MPSPLFFAGQIIEGVTEGLNTALPFLHSLVGKGLPANEILRQASTAGFAIRRSSGLAAIRQLKDISSASNYIKAVRNDFLPNPDRIAFAVTDIRRNYSYRVRVDGRDSVTGEKQQFFVQVTSDRLMTKSDAYAQAAALTALNAENYNFEFAAATVTEAVKSPRLARA